MFSAAFVDGLMLAATIQDDRRLDSVGAGLAPGLARSLAARLAELAALPREERHQAIRDAVRHLAAVPVDADLTPRVALILAADVPREVGRRWTSRAPQVRRGFRVSPSLRKTLRRLAAPVSTGAATDERAAAPRIAELSASRAAVLRAVAARHGGGERAIGALILGMEGRLDGDGMTRSLRRMGRELALVWATPWRA